MGLTLETNSKTNVGVSSVVSFPVALFLNLSFKLGSPAHFRPQPLLTFHLAAAKCANESSSVKIVLRLLWASTLIAERKCLSLSLI